MMYEYLVLPFKPVKVYVFVYETATGGSVLLNESYILYFHIPDASVNAGHVRVIDVSPRLDLITPLTPGVVGRVMSLGSITRGDVVTESGEDDAEMFLFGDESVALTT